ncbi:hypothetical protein Y032_0037g3363 [Ancylostoma ceylanicum]|uniref:Uncharacterized protein n=1 Tax=Ancylostoma ceylanicum TaxID=53326 RepID=A0A016UK09_9BILA|nr:hypothetical protein Y032_0037g3363 [Ancylostoma ceylanicum]
MSLEERKKEQKLRDEAQVWSPELRKHVDKVGRVQKVFTRMLYYRALPDPNYPTSLPPYSVRLRELGLKSSRYRRVVSDICTAFKILKGKSRLAAHRNGNHRASVSLQSFFARTSRWLNKLPLFLFDFNKTSSFKKALLQLDLLKIIDVCDVN